MSFQNKVKFALWAYPERLKDVEVHYKNDNCKSQSELIEKAIKFYIGYLDEEKGVNYISPMITETVKAQIKGTEHRLARLLFKVAVELGKLSAYYSSDAWKRDYAADEAGLLPKDLKRGVLSENGIYNLLEE